MKKIIAITFSVVFSLIVAYNSFAQVQPDQMISENTQPSYVAVNENMAVNLLFPYPVKRAQWVSQAISVQQFKGVENILLLKANKKDFPLTNVSVVTTDGHFFSFVVGYSAQLSVLNIQFKPSLQKPVVSFSNENGTNQASIEKFAAAAVKEKSNMKNLKETKNGIKFILDGIYINRDQMYFKIVITNSTNVNYDIDQLKFYIRDQKKNKRTATQELEQLPVFIQGKTTVIYGKSKNTLVYALPKFTIPDQKNLLIQLMEKNGGRHFELTVPNKAVIKAGTIY